MCGLVDHGTHPDPLAARESIDVEGDVGIDEQPLERVEGLGVAVGEVGHDRQPLERRQLLPLEQAAGEPEPRVARNRSDERVVDGPDLDGVGVEAEPVVVVAEHPLPIERLELFRPRMGRFVVEGSGAEVGVRELRQTDLESPCPSHFHTSGVERGIDHLDALAVAHQFGAHGER